MDHAEKELEELETPFEQKLAAQKEADKKRDEAQAEKRKLENPKAPHLVNLNEDPQLSQKIYYSLANFPVQIGRKTDQPKPQIIFGGIAVKNNHGVFTMLKNGLIQFELTNPEAYDQTYINGKQFLDRENPKQILSHLDTIYVGHGAMLLFKYPLLARKFKSLQAIATEEAKGEDGFRANHDGISEADIYNEAFSELQKQGVTGDLSQLTCEDYTEDEINHDYNSIDYETAYGEVERMEEIKRKEHLKQIQEQERLRLEEEFEKKQQEEQEKAEEMMNQLLEKQKQIESD